MGLRELQGVADNLAQMATAWPVRTDLEILAELPDGVIEIDLVSGASMHSEQLNLALRSPVHMRWWLRRRLRALRIPKAAITKARIVVEVHTDRLPTNRSKLVSFDWAASALLAISSRTFEGRLTERHMWYTRPVDGRYAEVS